MTYKLSEYISKYGPLTTQYIHKTLLEDSEWRMCDVNFLNYILEDTNNSDMEKYEIFGIIFKRRRRMISRSKIVNCWILKLSNIQIPLHDIIEFMSSSYGGISVQIFKFAVNSNFNVSNIFACHEQVWDMDDLNRKRLSECRKICEILGLKCKKFQRALCKELCREVGSVYDFNSIFRDDCMTYAVILPEIMEEVLMTYEFFDSKRLGYIKWINPVRTFSKIKGDFMYRGVYVPDIFRHPNFVR